MSSRGKLLVKLAKENLIKKPEGIDLNQHTKKYEDGLAEVLFEVPLNMAFELPEDITNAIQNQNILVISESENPNFKEIPLEEKRVNNLEMLDQKGESCNNITFDVIISATDECIGHANEFTINDPKMFVEKTNSPSNSESDNSNCNNDLTGQRELNEEVVEEDLSDNFDIENTEENTHKRKLHSRVQSKIKRLKGQCYQGYTRSKEGKVSQNFQRPQRSLKTRCLHKLPKHITKRTFRCAGSRKKMFNYFWQLSRWEKRKSYVNGVVICRSIQHRRKENQNLPLKKKGEHDCYMSLETGEKVLVCRDFFLKTLDLGRDTFQRWSKAFQDVADDGRENNLEGEENKTIIDRNRRTSNGRKTRDDALEWLKALPKVPSHYCRSSSKKFYIESVFRSKLHVYQEYKNYCLQSSKRYVSRTVFRNIFKEKKFSIHKPRKDQCDTCCEWQVKTISEEKYMEHIKKKNEAEEAKKLAKESASNEKLVVTMDLQSVLLAPKLEASAIYYKQKLQIHNFTVYSLGDKEVDLYVWHEANGKLTANEFTSCVIDYIKKRTKKMPSYKHVILISDGCGYQNRNKVLSSTLFRLAYELNITIEQLILEKGQTMMEADAVHSSLEAYFKPPIYAPSDYLTRMRQARPSQPYNIHNLDYNFFLNYEEIPTNYRTIRPGPSAKVNDFRAILYLPSGEMKYKLRQNEEWNDFNNVHVTNNTPETASRLYDHPNKISKSKYHHLQELKSIIEKDYHPFYDSLPHL